MESQLTAREALERLPAALGLPRGSVRVFARFQNGKLCPPVKVAVIRVPPSHLHVAAASKGGALETGLLERAVAALHLDDGSTELVVEYQDHGGQLRIHWIDFSWPIETPDSDEDASNGEARGHKL